MSDYGITAIRWNDDHTEVESCMVHDLEHAGGHVVPGDGKQMWYADVAGLIRNGDRVQVLEMNADGEYTATAEVKLRSGTADYLHTSPASSLFDLPVF